MQPSSIVIPLLPITYIYPRQGKIEQWRKSPMESAIKLSLCLLPLAVIFIVMKIALLVSASVSETVNVREDAKREHGPYLANAYADVDSEGEA